MRGAASAARRISPDASAMIISLCSVMTSSICVTDHLGDVAGCKAVLSITLALGITLLALWKAKETAHRPD